MYRVNQTHEELQQHFSEQLRFIGRSASAFDKGALEEAKRIATQLRVLLHNTKNSRSLLHQLDLETGTKFVDTALPSMPEGPVKTYNGLISVSTADDHYVPNLGEERARKDFETYWSKQVVLIDQKGNKFTRKDIVCSVANTDGGAHVDPSLPKDYHDLSRHNSLGWISKDHSGKWGNLYGAALACVRQIGHEILLTFGFSYKAEHTGNKILIGGVQVITEPVK